MPETPVHRLVIQWPKGGRDTLVAQLISIDDVPYQPPVDTDAEFQQIAQALENLNTRLVGCEATVQTIIGGKFTEKPEQPLGEVMP